jgi:hypothetical protein
MTLELDTREFGPGVIAILPGRSLLYKEQTKETKGANETVSAQAGSQTKTKLKLKN